MLIEDTIQKLIAMRQPTMAQATRELPATLLVLPRTHPVAPLDLPGSRRLQPGGVAFAGRHRRSGSAGVARQAGPHADRAAAGRR